MAMDRINQRRIVPAATINDVDEGLRMAEALLAGGLDIIEVTFRTAAAADAIRAIAREFPDMLLGAGTVLTLDQLARAADSGVTFAVAPGLNTEIVAKAQELGVSFIPGVMTPSEVDLGIRLGLPILKLFPASVVGGAKAVKALAGPYGHTGIKFLPTGGVSAANLSEYLAVPAVAAVGGSWMVARDLVQNENWAEITRLTREALAVVSAA